MGTAIRRERAGNPNTLDIPAGLNNEHHGLFAAITAINTQQPATAVFSRSANPTISAGQPATFMFSVTALEGFNCAVAFSCSGEPANFPYRHPTARTTSPRLGLVGMEVVESLWRRRWLRPFWWRWISDMCGLVLLVGVLVGINGCGGGSSNRTSMSDTQRGSATVISTATSGSILTQPTFSLTVQ